MTREQINHETGKRIIDVLVTYARQDIPSPSELSQSSEWFQFVSDEKLRLTLAETLYGALWVYRVGKLFATDRDELQAHLRTQIINYGAICEAVLEFTILQGAKFNLLKGAGWRFRDEKQNNKLKWGSPPANLPKEVSFAWCIRVAKEEGVIESGVEIELNRLRNTRNSIHLNKKATESLDYEPKQSKEAFELMKAVVDQARKWLENHTPNNPDGLDLK